MFTKKNKETLKRTWIGKYGYLFDDAETEHFSFEINVKIIDGAFEGTAFEQEFSGSTGDLIHVKGFIEGDFISFVKKYPYGYWKDENDEVIIDIKIPGHEVVYQGNFDQEKGLWKGEWEIEVDIDQVDEENDEVQVMVGVWDMKAKIV